MLNAAENSGRTEIYLLPKTNYSISNSSSRGGSTGEKRTAQEYIKQRFDKRRKGEQTLSCNPHNPNIINNNITNNNIELCCMDMDDNFNVLQDLCMNVTVLHS